MSVTTKLDTLDFIINILLEHEKKLDLLIDRLEKNTDLIADIIKKEKLIEVMWYIWSPKRYLTCLRARVYWGVTDGVSFTLFKAVLKYL